MRICIAQIKPKKGNVQVNIENHLEMINHSIKYNTDLIIFPELSLTSYEPKLANFLATKINDIIFNPFQEFSNKNKITIGIGMPIKATNGINISMLIFQPNKERDVYSKKMLHKDELPYFTSGKSQPLLNINGKKIAIGICYETLQLEHYLSAEQNDAEIHIASVAKSDKGINKVSKLFPKIAKEFKTPILMSNCVGYCDTFLSSGKSSIWDKNGDLISQLDETNQGILIYDTESGIVKTTYNTI